MLLCVDVQWVLIKMRVTVVTSGSPRTDVRKTTVVLTICQLELELTCFHSTYIEMAKIHLLLWNPPIFWGYWYEGPNRYVKRRACRAYALTKDTKPWAGLVVLNRRKWHGHISVQWPACWGCMSSYLMETMVCYRGEIKCEIKEG